MIVRLRSALVFFRHHSICQLNVGIVLVFLASATVARSEQNSAADASGSEPAAPVATDSPAQLPATDGETATSIPLKSGTITDPRDLEAFFDGAMSAELVTRHIAGGVVAVVADGKPLFAKGYGYADLESRRQVDAEKTLFRIGSISKLFTATAVMQQVEQEKIDLDADVNGYLKNVLIPTTFSEPITTKHLLSHTSGFEECPIGQMSQKPESILALDEVLRVRMPARVKRPGVIPMYCNYGIALAGYAVACVSEQSYDDCIEQRILKPLSMDQTLVRQPSREQLPPGMSVGYMWEFGQFTPQPFEYVPETPAGGMSMTGADAAKFMLALLNPSQAGDNPIIKAETIQKMFEASYQAPNVNGVCHGFMETKINGERMLGHNGSTISFHSTMQLLPERQIGVFLAFNTNTGGPANHNVLTAFFDRYYPQPNHPRLKSIAGFRDRGRRVAGEYMSTRYCKNGVGKLGALAGVSMVTANKDETITIYSIDGIRHYVEVEPLIFQEPDGQEKVIFHEGVNREIDAMYKANQPVYMAKRSAPDESIFLHGGVLLACTILFATAFFFWPVVAFSIDGLRAFAVFRSDGRGYLTLVGWLQSAVCLAFIIGVMIELRDPTHLLFGISPTMKILLMVPQVCAVLAGLTLLVCLFAWLRGCWYIPERLHFTLVAFAGAAFTWFLMNWNLLKFGA